MEAGGLGVAVEDGRHHTHPSSTHHAGHARWGPERPAAVSPQPWTVRGLGAWERPVIVVDPAAVARVAPVGVLTGGVARRPLQPILVKVDDNAPDTLPPVFRSLPCLRKPFGTGQLETVAQEAFVGRRGKINPDCRALSYYQLKMGMCRSRAAMPLRSMKCS